MAKKEKMSKRHTGGWFRTDLPLTSKRARIILSSPEDSKKLAKAVRVSRHGGSKPFKVSKDVKEKLESDN